MSHYKMMASGDLLNFFKMTADDIIYVTLPLYHVSALFFGLSNVLNKGKRLSKSYYKLIKVVSQF